MRPYEGSNTDDKDEDIARYDPLSTQSSASDMANTQTEDVGNLSQGADPAAGTGSAGESSYDYAYSFVGANDPLSGDGDTGISTMGETGTNTDTSTSTDTYAIRSYTAGASNVGVDSEDPEMIRADIEQTRADMSDTINAIQEKLNPQALIDKAKDSVHEATIGRVEQMVTTVTDNAKDTGNNLIQMAKDNPVPAALIGLGLAWLFTRNKSTSGNWQPDYRAGSQYDYSPRGMSRQNYGYGNYRPQPDMQRPSYQNQSSGFVEEIIDKVKENPIPVALTGLGITMLMKGNNGGSSQARGASYYDSASYRTNMGNSQGGGIGDAVGQVQEKVGDIAGQARDTAGDVAGQVKDVASNAAGTVGDAAGSVANKAGDVAGTVVDKAGDVAGTVADKAGDVAGAVAGKAGDLAGQTGDVGGKFLRTITENPIPAALAAVSIGWLYMESNSSGQRRLQKAGALVGDVAGQAGETVGQIKDTAGDTVGTVAEKTGSQFNRMLMENPLAVGAMTVAAGALIGMAIPETTQEHQLMGAMRDKVVERAQSVAHETLQKVQQTTDDVMQQVRTTASDAQANIENNFDDMDVNMSTSQM